MAADDDGASEFRGANFTGADFTGASFRDCDLSQVKITDSWLVDVRVSGLVGNFVVNDVDVTAFVEGELDKRHPERVQLRELRTAGDHRAMWDRIERLWVQTVARAGRLPESALHQRVDGEWSFVETLRHLVMATDRWAGYMILNNPAPYHPLGLPQPGFPPADAAALGIDLDARPSLGEVLEARGTRVALVRGIIDGLTDNDLERVCPRLPAAGYPEEARTVGRCLGVVMKEECEHRRYAVRDLAALEAEGLRPAADPGTTALPTAPRTCQTQVMATDGLVPGTGFAPCFPVRDMQAALAHYEQLGFTVMPYAEGITWGWARLGPAELHLFVKNDHDPATTAAAADLPVENADEFCRALRHTAADGTSDPYDTPYGREFVHVDPDNNLMRFITPATYTEATTTRPPRTQP